MATFLVRPWPVRVQEEGVAVPDWLPEVRARLQNKDRFQRLSDSSILNQDPIGSEFFACSHLESGSEIGSYLFDLYRPVFRVQLITLMRIRILPLKLIRIRIHNTAKRGQ
jgi:hypothetical protein